MRLAFVLLTAVAVLAIASGPAVAAKKSCFVSSSEKITPDKDGLRLHSLAVTGTGCTMGRTVEKAYQACRLKHGADGRCVKTVLGYACREQRFSGPDSFSAKTHCVKGHGASAKVVAFSYDALTGP